LLQGKKIVLGITGSIAAYKAATLVRLLVKSGADVKVLMTDQATKFIPTLTLSTLSKNEVLTNVSDGNSWNNHVEIGLWADLMIIAPATANTISKLANGICDNIILACYLSAKCKTIIAPAMDLDMWVHPSTKRNLQLITTDDVEIIPVGHGELASGLIGDGRMAEPEEILQYIENYFSKSLLLKGKKVLITAGPTYEAIDPVRFIGNRSSGKMGIDIANYTASLGAKVTLVLGPSHLNVLHSNIELITVESADDMYNATTKHFDKADITILAAAVADYKPEIVSKQKIKKGDANLTLELVKNKDIAATLGSKKKKNQLLIGFALETNDEIANAIKKIHKKNLDFIVLNSLNDKGAGFGGSNNKISIIFNENNIKTFDLKSKEKVAEDIVNEIITILPKK
jgi:phosphopantothenoylcysteine decarboxylase / phosphopantothenate---cysteine ligase